MPHCHIHTGLIVQFLKFAEQMQSLARFSPRVIAPKSDVAATASQEHNLNEEPLWE